MSVVHPALRNALGTLAVVAALLGSATVSADETATVRGVVFGAVDAPLEGVEVATDDGARTRTNADGAFVLVVPVGRRTLRVSGHPSPPFDAVDVVEIVVVLPATGDEVQFDIETRGAVEKKVVETAEVATGTVRGVVKHAEDGTPVEGARVYVRGANADATTGPDGAFELVAPEGASDLVVIHPDFSTATLEGTVAADEVLTLDVELTPAGVQLSDFTVTAPKVEGSSLDLLNERKESGDVSDVIGAEDMAKSGDSNAASALKRVTGVTIVGGRYVYVRGLGERYSSTLLDGAQLPSPEPERRVVPLDLFPADVLDSVVIQKTFSPERPGEFGGGVVQLRTRGFPSSFQAGIGLSTGLNTAGTFGTHLASPSGPWDWLGFDGGHRALPSAVANASENSALAESDRFSNRGYSAEELEAFGESMPNSWKIGSGTVPMDFGLSAHIGDGFDIGGVKTGYLLALVWDNGWDVRDSTSTIYVLTEGDRLELAHQYKFETVTNEVGLGGMFTFGADFGDDHSLRSTTLINRSTDNEIRRYSGENRDVGTTIEVSRLRFVERMLMSQQVRGEHVLPWQDLGLDWRYTFSLATRSEPDRREVRYDLEQGTGAYILSDRPEGNQRVFSELEDTSHDTGLDLRLPFEGWAGESAVKGGVATLFRERTVDTRRYKFVHKGPRSGDVDVLSNPPEQVFVPENIGADGFQFEETTRQTDNYEAGQEILAGYLMTELPLGFDLRLMAGARVESSTQTVTTFELFNPDNAPVEAKLASTDVLPAATISWDFTEGMVLRGGYSHTVSRPDFRELSPATFNDVTGGRQTFGNPDLKRALIRNADLRWEWYPDDGESLSVGAFFKDFQDPIETTVVVSAQHSVTYQNAKGAQNLGLEFEARKNLGFMGESFRDFSLSANLTLVRSEVELDGDSGIQTSDVRALQGQSPYVVNGTALYDNPDWGTSVAVLYNVFGTRISEVGALGAPDVVEEPFHQLDLVYKQKLGAGWKASFKAKNLLDLDSVHKQGPVVVETYRKGRAFSLGVGLDF